MSKNTKVAVAVLAATLSIAGAGPAATSVPVPKGASQQEALEALNHATGKLILAEKTRVDRHCERPINDLLADEGVPRLTEKYHLHALVGADRILFIRRFWDTKEPLDLPVEEIASTVSSLYELISPLNPHVKRTELLNDGFYKSLTPAQIAAAQNRDLRPADLTAEQQQAWSLIEPTLLFSMPEGAFGHEADLFSNWGATRLTWMPPDDEPQGRIEAMDLDWTAPGGKMKGLPFYGGFLSRGEPATGQELRAEPSSEVLAPAPRRKAPAPKPVTRCPARCGPFPQPVRLADLAAAIGAANGVRIDTPRWASDREFYVFAEGHTGDEVLEALAEVNGWRLRAAGPERFAIERPRVVPAASWADFYQEARALLPPVLLHMVPVPVPGSRPGEQFKQMQIRRSARCDLERWKIADHVSRLDPQHAGLPLSALDAGWRRRIANEILEYDLLPVLRNCPGNGPLNPWITSPELCHFHIEGDPEFDKRPTFKFEYWSQLANGEERIVSFGWVVNSHSPHQDPPNSK